jgi:hypothetical protein
MESLGVPGFLALVFLHVPLGASYVGALRADGGLTRSDIAKGGRLHRGLRGHQRGGANLAGKDKDNPHALTRLRWAARRPDCLNGRVDFAEQELCRASDGLGACSVRAPWRPAN